MRVLPPLIDVAGEERDRGARPFQRKGSPRMEETAFCSRPLTVDFYCWMETELSSRSLPAGVCLWVGGLLDADGFVLHLPSVLLLRKRRREGDDQPRSGGALDAVLYWVGGGISPARRLLRLFSLFSFSGMREKRGGVGAGGG